MPDEPTVTIAVHSYQQGRYLDAALSSIFRLDLPVEVIVCDGGSTDGSIDVIRKWQSGLAAWRSCSDRGQSAAVNEAIANGRAPYVAWLNSDDMLLPDGLPRLVAGLERYSEWPAAYGKASNFDERSQRRWPVRVEPFNARRLALRCIISQPACLIRRSAWQAVGGLDESLHMAMDYDLWWRLYRQCGPLGFVDAEIAMVRRHQQTKTHNFRHQHYAEAIRVVRRHHGRVPAKWWLAQPYAVWLKALAHWAKSAADLKFLPVQRRRP